MLFQRRLVLFEVLQFLLHLARVLIAVVDRVSDVVLELSALTEGGRAGGQTCLECIYRFSIL